MLIISLLAIYFQNIIRTWSVPSHIPLPLLYLRRVAPTGAQHPEGREVALTEAGPKAHCHLLWLKNTLGHDLTGFLQWLGKWFRLSIQWTWHGSQGELLWRCLLSYSCFSDILSYSHSFFFFFSVHHKTWSPVHILWWILTQARTCYISLTYIWPLT